MSEELGLLKLCRNELNKVLKNWDPIWVQSNWAAFEGLVGGWWAAYKKWEAKDTFDEAVQDKRMTMRSFPVGFDEQKSKTFAKGTISVPDNRFFVDSQYTRMNRQQQGRASDAYRDDAEKQKYWARRGIDSTAFANPANFTSREKKYEEGLHDLSASLMNPKLSIFDQIHNNEDGAHFSFLPLSPEEDQEVLYDLTRFAKALRLTFPKLDLQVRPYRAEMTRVKIAQEFDMGVGYIAVPAARPGTGPQYKLRYGLGSATTIPGESKPISVTAQMYTARQQAALKFKSILGIRDAKNEIVIAIRKHAGPFPVYAVRSGDRLICYKIASGVMMRTGDEISPHGRLIRISMVERGTTGLPVREPAKVLAYNSAPDAIDATFRNRFDTALNELGEIPKRSGMRVFVVGPKYDETFRRVLADVETKVHDLNHKGFRLTFASLPNRTECRSPEVRLYFV